MLFIVSLLITITHVLEELLGEGGPLWKYFGAISEVNISDRIGFLLFTIGLTITLGVITAFGYLANSEFAISLLLGARIGDSIFSHWVLAFIKRPNPGIYTTLLFVAESIFIFRIVHDVNEIAVCISLLSFASIIPILRGIKEIKF